MSGHVLPGSTRYHEMNGSVGDAVLGGNPNGRKSACVALPDCADMIFSEFRPWVIFPSRQSGYTLLGSHQGYELSTGTPLRLAVADVIEIRTDPQMVGAHACRIIASVKNARRVKRYRANEKHPRSAVGPHAATEGTNLPVTLPVPASHPKPTLAEVHHVSRGRAVLVHSLHERRECIFSSSHRRASSILRGSAGQGRPGVASTFAARSFYHLMAENPNKSARKAA